jgi:hypothetical protein
LETLIFFILFLFLFLPLFVSNIKYVSFL